jgi:ZIP family zinc transporter
MGFLASLAAGLLTAVGALPVLVGRSVSRRMHEWRVGSGYYPAVQSEARKRLAALGVPAAEAGPGPK